MKLKHLMKIVDAVRLRIVHSQEVNLEDLITKMTK
jgi:hypothetical protein